MSNQNQTNKPSLIILLGVPFLVFVAVFGYMAKSKGSIHIYGEYYFNYKSRLFFNMSDINKYYDRYKRAEPQPVTDLHISWNPNLKIYNENEVIHDKKLNLHLEKATKEPLTGRYDDVEYKDGKRHGLSRKNNSEGYLRRLSWYHNSEEQKTKIFRSDGTLWQQFDYKDTKMPLGGGPNLVKFKYHQTFYRSGSLQSSSRRIAKNRRLDGQLKRFREDGTLVSDTVWKQGKLIKTNKILFSNATNPSIYSNSIGMEFVLIPPGSFIMGDDFGNDASKPAHNVQINQAFYLSKYEVTIGQLKELIGFTPVHLRGISDDIPVTNIEGYDLIFALNAAENCRDCYRYPTETEWEYAARAGTSTKYYWGNEINDEYAWYADNSDQNVHPVGLKKPNNWGLHDMIGNVWEQTEWRPDDPAKLERQLKMGYLRTTNADYLLKISIKSEYQTGKYRSALVTRGGSFTSLAKDSTVSTRKISRFKQLNRNTGFRLYLKAY